MSILNYILNSFFLKCLLNIFYEWWNTSLIRYAIITILVDVSQTYFVAGNVVMITSRTSLKCLSVDNNGAVSCNVPPLKISTATAHFQIVPSIYSPTAYKLRNMAYPNFYLAIFNGNLIGNVRSVCVCVHVFKSFF